MIELKSEDSFHLNGKGQVYTLRAPFDINVADLKQNGVIIDGATYSVHGIERLAVNLGKSAIHKGETIGILVGAKDEIQPGND